jgi:hypothetical protein
MKFKKCKLTDTGLVLVAMRPLGSEENYCLVVRPDLKPIENVWCFEYY